MNIGIVTISFLPRISRAGDGPPFLFTSGYAPEELLPVEDQGPTPPILPKPWSAEELLRAVRSALEDGRARLPEAGEEGRA